MEKKAQAVAELSVKTLQMMRNDESFSLFWELVKLTASKCDIGDPVLPRHRKAPLHYEVGRAVPEFSSSPEAKFQKCILITCITARFKQPGYVMYKNLEELPLHAANGKTLTMNSNLLLVSMRQFLILID